jgi:ABC-type spermidine/putrescine transport systems, ATPase components
VVDGIECRYGAHTVVRDLSFRVRRGGLVCLLGPSGCGKSTILRAIAGFEPVYAGQIMLDGNVISRPGLLIPPEKRRLGMVFQDYALFPHLSVIENVGFGVRQRSRKARHRVAEEMLERMGLVGLSDRYPDELSGGQQQRVALGRSLASHPRLVLLDEPFSNLDVNLHERLCVEVHDLLKTQAITGILVTHDQYEAFAMGEKVGIIQDGRIIQWDTPYNLYHEPANRFVADFVGQGKFLKGTLMASGTVKTEAGIIKGKRTFFWPQGTEVDVLLRPDDIVPDPDGTLRAQIVNKTFKGAEILYTLRLATGTTLLSLFPSHFNHEVGKHVGIRIEAAHLVAFPRNVD